MDQILKAESLELLGHVAVDLTCVGADRRVRETSLRVIIKVRGAVLTGDPVTGEGFIECATCPVITRSYLDGGYDQV